MNKKSNFLYVPIFLTLIIPVPGRFVFGFVLFLELLFLTLVGTFINSLINKLNFDNMRSAVILIGVIAATILFRQIFVIICPEIALTLGFIMYLPPVSLFLIGILFNDTAAPLLERLKHNMGIIFIFSFSGLLFFLIRDLLGYGTFTFIGKNHQIFEKVLFASDNFAVCSFLASIPGALIFASILFSIAVLIRKKLHIVKNAETNK